MDVDSNGYISALLKALYGSTPTGVACDADGRLKFFLTDNVDQWGQYLEVGNAELAARLNRLVVSYDRRGQTLFWDDFRDGLGAWTTGGSNGGTAALQTTDALQGVNCMALNTPASAAATASAYIYLPRPVPTSGIGFGVCFSYTDSPWYITVKVEYGDGTSFRRAILDLNMSGAKLYYWGDNAAYNEFSDWEAGATGANVWHYAKVAFSLDTNKYLYAVVDGVEYDLSAYDVYETASSTVIFMAHFEIYGVAAGAQDVLLDCINVTTQE